jgi:hypothetical protein
MILAASGAAADTAHLNILRSGRKVSHCGGVRGLKGRDLEERPRPIKKVMEGRHNCSKSVIVSFPSASVDCDPCVVSGICRLGLREIDKEPDDVRASTKEIPVDVIFYKVWGPVNETYGN